MQQTGTKNYFRLNRGLNTEANELNFPDGFTVDEQNYELLPDGSRRRRKGLAEESGGASHTVPTISNGVECQSYLWKNVGGDPSNSFVVHKFGNELHFSSDAETISTTFKTNTIDLSNWVVDSTTTASTVASAPVTFSSGRGHLFVAGVHTKPFYVEYDAALDEFSATGITILVRDFEGIEDGIGLEYEPTGTITADHKYNLRNRGWKQADMDTYLSDKSKHPAKNAIWFKGYRRQTDASYADEDGIQVWDSDKIEDELFGNASAPQGSLLLDPLDTTYAATGAAGSGQAVPIASFSLSGTTLTVTTGSAHGFPSGTVVTVSGQSSFYDSTILEPDFWSFNGSYPISNLVGTTQFDITVNPPPNFDSWRNQYFNYGQIDGEALPKSDGEDLSIGPTAVAFHAGRVWYAGVGSSEWADTVFFSKIAQKPKSYGQCYQEADPTDFYLNSITVADGGAIVIPGLGGVKKMLSVRGSILIFSDKGVWEISGGSQVFTATMYQVRQLTDAECTSTYSPLSVDVGALYTSTKGIYQIAPNQYTGVLEATNISEQLIQKKWNAIGSVYQTQVQTVYDDALKRIYFLHGSSDGSGWTNHYTDALVLDFRVGAWYKYKFNSSSTDAILTAYAISESDSTDDNKKIKWSCSESSTSITTCDLDQTNYIDFDGAESPLPYMYTGWDNIGDFQKRKQAPVITVYSKKTETGFTATGNGLDPVNESSTTMTAHWDWSDDATAGKIGDASGAGQQVYRHVRAFSPNSANTIVDDPLNNSGYPVVVTRNKVRGRGRALQLKFEGAATKDTHILGFTTNYKVTRKI